MNGLTASGKSWLSARLARAVNGVHLHCTAEIKREMGFVSREEATHRKPGNIHQRILCPVRGLGRMAPTFRIPTDETLLGVEDYKAFLAARRKLIAGRLNEFLGDSSR